MIIVYAIQYIPLAVVSAVGAVSDGTVKIENNLDNRNSIQCCFELTLPV